jgi:DNA-binding transcriptional MerR regulator/methylmalonyl-CoA mutase cobalamin-binding subunit
MRKKNLYPIRYVSQHTGLTPHAIRAWEKRYKAVVPDRSPKNRRLYSKEDVKRLQLLKTITDAGHNISQVAQLDTKELSGLAQRELSALPRKHANIRRPLKSADAGEYLRQCLSAVLNLDPEGLERFYDQAVIDLTRSELLKAVILPLFEEIGNLWQNGSLKIVNEHMATTVTRSFLLNMLRANPISQPAPKIVIATPAGQWHDQGALVVALTAAENGWHPLYYGPNLPADEIAACVKQSGARALAISITHLLSPHSLIDELCRLRRYVGKDVALFIGGRAVAEHSQKLAGVNAKFIKEVEQLGGALNSLLAADFSGNVDRVGSLSYQ